MTTCRPAYVLILSYGTYIESIYFLPFKSYLVLITARRNSNIVVFTKELNLLHGKNVKHERLKYFLFSEPVSAVEDTVTPPPREELEEEQVQILRYPDRERED